MHPHAHVPLAAATGGQFHPHLALEVDHQVLRDGLAAGEERRAGGRVLQDAAHHLAIAVDEVHVARRHPAVLQQPHEVLRHDGHPAAGRRRNMV